MLSISAMRSSNFCPSAGSTDALLPAASRQGRVAISYVVAVTSVFATVGIIGGFFALIPDRPPLRFLFDWLPEKFQIPVSRLRMMSWEERIPLGFCVAATFSAKTAEANGMVIGKEDRALGIDVSLQPFVNIVRDLEFGRAYNTFGEDPFLTSVVGAAEIKGIQSQHVMAQVKHYVGYDSDNENTFIDDQTLHEIYVAPFDAAIP